LAIEYNSSLYQSDSKLFLKFAGPAILLIQSRAPRLSDTFTAKDVAEVGELDPSAQEAIVENIQRYTPHALCALTNYDRPKPPPSPPLAPSRPNVLKIAVVKDGKVVFQDTETFKEFR